MLTYNLKIALKSLRRNPVLTALLIGAIALGICVSTSFVTLRHLYTQDFLPGKSDEVFYVQLDTWGAERPFNEDRPELLPDLMTYRDARNLMQSKIPVRQSPMYITQYFVHPDPKMARPFQANVRLATSDFFEMFRLPFRYGGPWTKAADAKPEAVAVIDHETNEKVFGGENSVGKTIRLEERYFRVVGVLAPFRPALRVWELNRNPTGPPEPVYIPFNFTQPLEVPLAGNASSWKQETLDTYEQFLNSEMVWLQYWVELPDEASQRAYKEWLDHYARDQKKLGRFPRPVVRTSLSTIPQIIERNKFIPESVTTMSIVSLLFLVVCSVNLIGILLGKFLARVPEVSVRRALGASRAQIFWQHVVECELIGVAGGALGILLSLGLLEVLAKFVHSGEALRLDGEMLLVAGFLSLVAGLVAGVYPAWRVCSVPPAMQLKVQ
ncbi:MAG TPA: ABC transporter permease [Thermoanaerobaculia bacterium]|jgi:putative ABC transport system permease protein|nr:ABC transporter permease [Thermoanaerobaculia bacterium]